MAKYNEILVGRYNRFMAKLFSMKTGGAVVPQLASEIQPVFPLFSGVEHRFLESWERFSGGGNVAPVIGQVSAMNLRNPVGSNVIAVVEKLAVSEATLDTAGAVRNAIVADLNTLNTPTRLDSRGRASPTCILSRNTNAPALGTFVYTWSVAANQTLDLVLYENQEFTLLPGDGLQVLGGVANQSVNFAWMWRERFLEDSERA
jgi:hypothetical protein